jgi:hypothetical protein
MATLTIDRRSGAIVGYNSILRHFTVINYATKKAVITHKTFTHPKVGALSTPCQESSRKIMAFLQFFWYNYVHEHLTQTHRSG